MPHATIHTSETPDTPVSTGFWARLRALFGFKDLSFRDNLEEVLEEANQDEVAGQSFSAQERAMLRNILALRDRRVRDVMVPRADIIAVDEDMTLHEVLQTFRAHEHSRLPVYRHSLDEPVGMVHMKDVLKHIVQRVPHVISDQQPPETHISCPDLNTPLKALKLNRPLLFVPSTMMARDLLVKMQVSRTHLALVIDEFGGTDGLLSIEDLVEEIVGDIFDEHDTDDDTPKILREPFGVLADGRASLVDVSEAVGLNLAVDEAAEIAEDVDTLSGFVVALAGRVPVKGELVAGSGGVEFEIVEADPRRVKRVRVRVVKAARP